MSKQIFCIYFLLFFCLRISSCIARHKNYRNNPACVPSSCGNLNNIAFPFRLKTDPKNCGHSDFELDCQNNHTILTLNSKKFRVQAITYNNFSIRVVDPGLDNDNSCSFPAYSSILYDDIPSSVYNIFYYYDNQLNDYNVIVAFIKCLKPVKSSRYVNNSACSSSTNAISNSSRVYSYVAVGGETMMVSDLEDSCGVERFTKVSKRAPIRDSGNTLKSIHELLAYGFEMTWYRVLCEECEASHGTCGLQGNAVTCRHYCPEDVPLSQLGFGCKWFVCPSSMSFRQVSSENFT